MFFLVEMLRHSHQQLLLPQVEDDVGEEQRVEILTQEITQVHVFFFLDHFSIWLNKEFCL